MNVGTSGGPMARRSYMKLGLQGCRLRAALSLVLFFCSGPRENSRQAVVTLVAGMLEQRTRARNHGDLPFPRFHKRCRIVHREFVQEDIGTRSGEALGQMQIFIGTSEFRTGREICRVHNEGVALPVPS